MTASEYQRSYQSKWIKERKAKIIQSMGPCHFCGSTENLEIHHRDPDKKESHKIWSWTDKRIEGELNQCIPLCKACHKKLHDFYKTKPLIHGTLHGFDRAKCRCDLCVAAKRASRRIYKRCEKVTELAIQDEMDKEF